MEVEAQPLLLEDDDEKLTGLTFAPRSTTERKHSRLRSWAVAITTHASVALLVLLAVTTFSPVAELWNAAARARPTLYCMFEKHGAEKSTFSTCSLIGGFLSTAGSCHRVYHRPSARGCLVQSAVFRAGER